MKKLVSVLVVFFLVLTSVITCPDKAMHKEAIMTVVKNSIHNEINKSSDESNIFVHGALSLFGSSIVEFVVDNYLVVDNYFVFSVGKIDNKDEKVVSLGLFNHVFTFSKEDIQQAMDNSDSDM